MVAKRLAAGLAVAIFLIGYPLVLQGGGDAECRELAQ